MTIFFLVMELLIHSALSKHLLQIPPQTSNLPACAELLHCSWCRAIGTHVTNLKYQSSVKIWGSYWWEPQSRSDSHEWDPLLLHLPTRAALRHTVLPPALGCKAEFSAQMQKSLLHTTVH